MNNVSLNVGEIITLKVDLNKPTTLEGNQIEFDIKKGHILHIVEHTQNGLLCELEEDIASRNEGHSFQYGKLFIPLEYLSSPESILEARRIQKIFEECYL